MLLAMEIYDLLVVVLTDKEELKCITIQYGVPFVMITEITQMLELCVDN